jgi:hypothetical protein
LLKETGTYRLCEACGLYVPSDEDICPECGAGQGDVLATPDHHSLGGIWLGLVVAGILILSLWILSRDREVHRAAEKIHRNILRSETLGVPLQAKPTPPPKPTATPPPRPTPTLAPKATPTTPWTQVFGATPTPAPTATPEPAPVVARSASLELKDQLIVELSRKLDETLPMYEPGAFIRLVLTANRTESGTLLRLENQYLILSKGPATQLRISYRELAPESRIRVDSSERSAFVEEKALEEVLRRMDFRE